jgi:Putative stress-responsive transcriptional regulator
MRTKRWTRSPRGKIFGVATGLAEWRDLPVRPVQLIVFLSIVFTGFFPGAIIYLIVALCLPLQSEADIIDGSAGYAYGNSNCGSRPWSDAEFTENGKSTEDLKNEYEALKKKVEKMEGQMFDKEKDWDERFNGEEK